MENAPGESLGQWTPEALATPEAAAEKAPETLSEAAQAELGREALSQAAEALRPAEAMLGGNEGTVEVALGTTGVDGQDIVDDGKTEAVGTDDPEKHRRATEKAFVERVREMKKLAGENPKRAQDELTGARWEYMRVMFGRQMGDGITGQKGGLAG